ncbi:MAG: 8-oxo-dGTP diphosphatase MutT [Coleofasciculaceae cyanobacterium SM2_3_26]|nr:8-oxo-dGTP diphosphatase MutT [Coleofasciculaceae cyanobacterium SM2_3_26]
MTEKPHKYIGVAVIWNDRGEILIDRRLPQGTFGGFWEFPGGKVELGESIPDCIYREIREELGVEVEVGEHLVTVEHTYDRLRVTLVVHHCYLLDGEPRPIECQEIRWVTLSEIDTFSFPAANVQIVEALRKAPTVDTPAE